MAQRTKNSGHLKRCPEQEKDWSGRRDSNPRPQRPERKVQVLSTGCLEHEMADGRLVLLTTVYRHEPRFTAGLWSECGLSVVCQPTVLGAQSSASTAWRGVRTGGSASGISVRSRSPLTRARTP